MRHGYLAAQAAVDSSERRSIPALVAAGRYLLKLEKDRDIETSKTSGKKAGKTPSKSTPGRKKSKEFDASPVKTPVQSKVVRLVSMSSCSAGVLLKGCSTGFKFAEVRPYLLDQLEAKSSPLNNNLFCTPELLGGSEIV